MRKGAALCFAVLMLLPSAASPQSFFETSARAGLGLPPAHISFNLYELHGGYQFAPFFTWGKGWSLTWSAVGSVGMLDDSGQRGAIIGIGPRLALHSPSRRWTFYISTRASGLTRTKFGDFDLGGWFSFDDNIGVRYAITEHLTLGYAFEHVSNGGIYSSNSGASFNIIEIGWRF